MQVGIIAPIKFLREYCITNIQYCLPSLLVENEEYKNFYKERKKAGDTIILDCKKPGWKKEPEDWDLVQWTLEYLKPSMIILPSHMYSSSRTIEIASEYKAALPKMKLVGCLEGTSYEEVGKCLVELRKITSTIAIPSHLYNTWKGEKYEGPKIYIDNYLRIEELDKLDGILVTALPVRLGLQGRLLSNYLPSPPSLTFYEVEDKYPMITKKNVEEVINYYET